MFDDDDDDDELGCAFIFYVTVLGWAVWAAGKYLFDWWS